MRRLPIAICVLAAALSAPATAAELAPVQVVQLVQSALRVLGYLAEPVDGIDGRKTREAYAAAAIALDWPRIPAGLDAGVAEELNRAAAPAVARLLGVGLDGRWVLATGDVISDLIACTDPVATAVVIEGLVAAFPATGDIVVLDLEGGRLAPLPAEGERGDSEAHGFRPLDADTLETVTEGDAAAWRRCPAG